MLQFDRWDMGSVGKALIRPHRLDPYADVRRSLAQTTKSSIVDGQAAVMELINEMPQKEKDNITSFIIPLESRVYGANEF